MVPALAALLRHNLETADHDATPSSIQSPDLKQHIAHVTLQMQIKNRVPGCSCKRLTKWLVAAVEAAWLRAAKVMPMSSEDGRKLSRTRHRRPPWYTRIACPWIPPCNMGKAQEPVTGHSAEERKGVPWGTSEAKELVDRCMTRTGRAAARHGRAAPRGL